MSNPKMLYWKFVASILFGSILVMAIIHFLVGAESFALTFSLTIVLICGIAKSTINEAYNAGRRDGKAQYQ